MSHLRLDILTEIEQNDTASRTVIYSLGGAGFAICAENKVMYIDPYLSLPDPSKSIRRSIPIPFSPQRITKADVIISTHEHQDHCDPLTIRAFEKGTRAIFLGPSSSVRKAMSLAFPTRRVRALSPGDLYEVSPSVKIIALESVDPYAQSSLCYLIETPRGNVFHSGDSSYFDGFKKAGSLYRVDVALLNFGKQVPSPEKPYYMSAKSVALAAKDLNASILIPMHWDLWEESVEDPSLIKEPLDAASRNTVLEILRIGDKFEL